VFFSFHLPFGSGATLNVPVLTMIKPVSTTSGQAQADRPA
jgi:hypothetical protein